MAAVAEAATITELRSTAEDSASILLILISKEKLPKYTEIPN